MTRFWIDYDLLYGNDYNLLIWWIWLLWYLMSIMIELLMICLKWFNWLLFEFLWLKMIYYDEIGIFKIDE